MTEELDLQAYRKLVADRNAQEEKREKKKTERSTVHSTAKTFNPELVDKFMKDMEPMVRKHFTGIIQEEIDRDRIVIRTAERIKVEIKVTMI